MIHTIPTEWLERCLEIIALDPETRQPSVGMPCGARRPELGPAIQDLECQICGATWAGIIGDPCWWCERSAEIQLEHQADLLLRAPECDPDDVTYDDRMRGWIQRMKIGTEAGIITKQQAEQAWNRHQQRAA